MRRLIAFVALCVVSFTSGCGRQPLIRDSSRLAVQSGKGITNVCEVGMTIRQVRHATRDVNTSGIYDDGLNWKRLTVSRHAIIQSLGVVAPIGDDGKLQTICFYVLPEKSSETLPGLSITNPFRGTLSEKLSFNHGPVSRADIELEFGSVERVITNLSDGLPLANEGKPFLYRAPNGSETLHYRHKGIDFDIRSNKVFRFWVYAVRGAGVAAAK